MKSGARLLLAALAVCLVIGLGHGDVPLRTATHPDDPALVQGSQWNLAAIGAPAAWRRATGRGMTIAIVDSGIDAAHVELAGKVVGSTDCIGAAGDPTACHGDGRDDDGHGTHVAAIAAALTDNGNGIAGVAPDARLLSVRVLADRCERADCSAAGSTRDVIAGIRWATAHGADVVNLSLGTEDGSLRSPALASAVRAAWAAGVVVVAAAGNQVLTAGLARLPIVVVTAVGPGLTAASYARGVGRARWGISAPGGEAGDTPESCRAGGHVLGILAATWQPGSEHDRYACLAGTSMAAPQVAGAVALLRSAGLGPADAVARLLATARDLGRPGVDTTYGAGLLALDRATQPPGTVLADPDPAAGVAVAAAGSSPVAGTVLPRPTRPSLPLTMLAGSILALASTEAYRLARRMWRERA